MTSFLEQNLEKKLFWTNPFPNLIQVGKVWASNHYRLVYNISIIVWPWVWSR